MGVGGGGGSRGGVVSQGVGVGFFDLLSSPFSATSSLRSKSSGLVMTPFLGSGPYDGMASEGGWGPEARDLVAVAVIRKLWIARMINEFIGSGDSGKQQEGGGCREGNGGDDDGKLWIMISNEKM